MLPSNDAQAAFLGINGFLAEKRLHCPSDTLPHNHVGDSANGFTMIYQGNFDCQMISGWDDTLAVLAAHCLRMDGVLRTFFW